MTSKCRSRIALSAYDSTSTTGWSRSRRALLGGEDHRRSGVDRVVAVEDAQRLRHVARREVVVERDRLAEDRVVVHRRVVPLRDDVATEVLLGRAVLRHVPLREHPGPLHRAARAERHEELAVAGSPVQHRRHRVVGAARPSPAPTRSAAGRSRGARARCGRSPTRPRRSPASPSTRTPAPSCPTPTS